MSLAIIGKQKRVLIDDLHSVDKNTVIIKLQHQCTTSSGVVREEKKNNFKDYSLIHNNIIINLKYMRLTL